VTSVLIVDDDRALVGMVASLLGSEGYDLLTAYDGETALRRHAEELPDLVILDRRLPKLSGDEICRRIRATSATPILMLTGERGEDERVALLDLGADDYLEKPFGRKELLARVRALLRRAPRNTGPTTATDIGGLIIDARAHTARMGRDELPLTPTEFRLLAALATRPGELVDR
jgi:DNA-binding response OmpR family regulator